MRPLGLLQQLAALTGSCAAALPQLKASAVWSAWCRLGAYEAARQPGSLCYQHGGRWELLDCLQARRDKVTENAGLLREVADLRREQKGLRHELGRKQQELRQLEFAFDEYKRQARCLWMSCMMHEPASGHASGQHVGCRACPLEGQVRVASHGTGPGHTRRSCPSWGWPLVSTVPSWVCRQAGWMACMHHTWPSMWNTSIFEQVS